MASLCHSETTTDKQAPPVSHARALFEYTRQTDEEVSFPEDAALEVFDSTDPDWILVGIDDEYGFAPSNYIELQSGGGAPVASPAAPAAPSLPSRPQPAAMEPESPPPSGPAAALAGVMAGRAAPQPSTPPLPTRAPSQSYNAHVSDDEPVRSPTLPTRPRPAEQQVYREASPVEEAPSISRTPGGFHMYNISEMISVLGKRKKVPTTLGINLGTGMLLIAPERASDGPSQEWSADRMTHYSREGKHVFMELVRPSKSLDFHAGAKDTAEEIVSALGEMAGAIRAEGLREVIEAGSKKNMRKGLVVYDFMAQGEDEVTVATGDEVFILDDSKSDEWWQVRRLKNGKEGVVPSSYVEITGTVTPPPESRAYESTLTTVEKNRQEELRLTKEAMKAGRDPQQVGPGMRLPERGSSLAASEHDNNQSQQRSRRENGNRDGGQSRSKPSKSAPVMLKNWLTSYRTRFCQGAKLDGSIGVL